MRVAQGLRRRERASRGSSTGETNDTFMNSFQTTLTPDPEKLSLYLSLSLSLYLSLYIYIYMYIYIYIYNIYIVYSVMKQEDTCF